MKCSFVRIPKYKDIYSLSCIFHPLSLFFHFLARVHLSDQTHVLGQDHDNKDEEEHNNYLHQIIYKKNNLTKQFLIIWTQKI